MKKLAFVSLVVLSFGGVAETVMGMMFHFDKSPDKCSDKTTRQVRGICSEENSGEGGNEFIKSLVREIYDRAEKVLASTKESKDEDSPQDICESVANSVEQEKEVKNQQNERSLERDKVELPE